MRPSTLLRQSWHLAERGSFLCLTVLYCHFYCSKAAQRNRSYRYWRWYGLCAPPLVDGYVEKSFHIMAFNRIRTGLSETDRAFVLVIIWWIFLRIRTFRKCFRSGQRHGSNRRFFSFMIWISLLVADVLNSVTSSLALFPLEMTGDLLVFKRNRLRCWSDPVVLVFSSQLYLLQIYIDHFLIIFVKFPPLKEDPHSALYILSIPLRYR